MRQYLIEGAEGGFTFLVDRSKPFVTESRPGGKYTRIPGRFSVCDCINGNNRRYRKPVWEKNLAEGSPLQESIKRNAAFGLLEHPLDGKISLLSPISHLVTSAKLVESKEGTKTVYEVHGEIEILETEEGKKLKALVEAGYNPMVSSRGYGSLQRASDGVDEVLDDYVCESWDVVIKPSFVQAELIPNREPEKPGFAEAQKPNDVRVVQEQQQTPKATPPSTAPVAPASAKPPVKESIMNLNEIKGRIALLRGVNPANNPQRFAESVEEVKDLHVQIDQFISEDAKTRNYAGTRLHSDLDAIERRWNESAIAPVKQAKRLTENNMKLMKVVHATAKTGLALKGKLSEALTQISKGEKLTEDLIRKGQGWRQVAESRKDKLQVVSKHFDTACDALDIMTEKYHKDTTEMGRRLIVLEFAEKAQTPEIQKALKEATRLRDIAAVREQLEGKKVEGTEEGTATAPVAAATATTESKKDSAGKPAEGAPVNEGKKETTPAAPAAGKTPTAPVAEAKVTLSSSVRDPRSVNESIEMVRRMSTATAK
jgi:hypothetical protein